MIKYYTIHVYYITTKSKSKIYNMCTKAHEVDEDLASQKRESSTKGLELFGLLTKISLILRGWLHFVPSFGI